MGFDKINRAGKSAITRPNRWEHTYENHDAIPQICEKLVEIVNRSKATIVFSRDCSRLQDLHDQIVVEHSIQADIILQGDHSLTRVTLERFQRGEIPVLFLNLEAFSTGVNLSNADQCVFIDEDFNPVDNHVPQAECRAHRMGRKGQLGIGRINRSREL